LPSRSTRAISSGARRSSNGRARPSSGGYGYTVGASVAYAYLPPEHAAPDTEVTVEIFGEWVPGRVVREPLHDPDGARVRS